MRSIKVLSVSLLCTAVAALFASELRAAETTPSPLIRYVRHARSTLLGSESRTDRLIFRDGLVIERLNSKDELCWVARSQALGAKLGELREALTRNRVALQEGECQIEELIDNLVVETRVTWFGKGRRQNSYRTTNSGTPCSAGIHEIDQAIQTLFSTASRGEEVPIACP